MKKSPKKINSPELSVIIVSYNTKDILDNCLNSLSLVKGEANFEVIVSDNASVDGSVEMVKERYSWVKLIENSHNLGFSKANNKARDIAKGLYVLFLNSDTLVPKNTIKNTLSYIKERQDVGILTVRTLLVNGEDDKDTRRSFPTPWVALTHFSGLDRIYPKSRLFSRYWYGYKPADLTQEVDVVQGAFLLTRKSVLDKTNWFDEDYFLDGEDIDLCWKVKKLGMKIVYYPKCKITHLKKASKNKKKNTYNVVSGVRAMEVFYRKNMWKEYPLVLNALVVVAIRALMAIRYIKLKLL